MEEQRVLETVLEASKPPVPPDCRHLHYLLSTPFRYGAPYPSGSRFRRAGFTPGVFYASATPSTAVAEAVFHRLLFFADSPATPWPQNPGEHTVFSARFRTAAALDLLRPPLSGDRGQWEHLSEYSACQQLAEGAREAGIEIVKYGSARVPGINYAALVCRAFASPQPIDRQTWRIHLGPGGARAVCGFPESRLAFDRHAFAADRRIAALAWER
ncbi:MAG TPA: RES family NAD+ phosphorylase [Vicinamibacterales bacterium]|nr:RES family NAD+ phosphorylase [Vicinamibacterales bacterium]